MIDQPLPATDPGIIVFIDPHRIVIVAVWDAQSLPEAAVVVQDRSGRADGPDAVGILGGDAGKSGTLGKRVLPAPSVVIADSCPPQPNRALFIDILFCLQGQVEFSTDRRGIHGVSAGQGYA